LSDRAALHVTHAMPPAPQLGNTGGTSHFVPEQHPAEQDVGLHTHAPPVQI
jgi:hypothetical protein